MDLGFYLGIPWNGAFAVVVTTLVIYPLLTFVVRRWGQRLFASPAPSDLALVLMIGALAGRTLLGPDPTLVGGLVALATLGVLRVVTIHLRGNRGAVAGGEALMVGADPDLTAMARHHVDEHALWSALRQAGVRTTADVGLVVLEQNGRISVLLSDQPVHRDALVGVRGADQIHARLTAAGLA